MNLWQKICAGLTGPVVLVSLAWCGPTVEAKHGGEALTKEERVRGLLTIYVTASQPFAWCDRLPRLDWDRAFVEYLPRVEHDQGLDEYYRGLQHFVALLEDGHSESENQFCTLISSMSNGYPRALILDLRDNPEGEVRICAVQVRCADGHDFVPMGLRPDVPVNRTFYGVMEGGDDALLAAIDQASPTLDLRPTEVLLTGNEQSTMDHFASAKGTPVASQFLNSLDHAVMVLIAKAVPPPQQEQLVEAAVSSMAEACVQTTGRKTGAADQRKSRVSSVLLSGSFESVLDEMASASLQRQQLVEAGLAGMLEASGWSSACVLSPIQAEELRQMSRVRAARAEEPGILGIRLERWPVAGVLPGSSAAEAGLRDGDILVTVDGTDTSSAKTIPEQLKLLQGPAGAVSKFTVRRAGQTRVLTVKRTSAAAARTSFEKLKPGVWLIKIPTFEGSGIAEKVKGFIEKQKAATGVTFIIDLRENGGGRPEEANGVADLFLSDKVLQICEFRDGTRIAFKSHPGAVDGRVILLTSPRTGSAAEMLIMALRDNSRATVVGETTAGALFGKETAELVGGQTILFRIDPTVLSPTGQDYSLTGIPSDLKVPAGADRIPDAVLSRALELAP